MYNLGVKRIRLSPRSCNVIVVTMLRWEPPIFNTDWYYAAYDESNDIRISIKSGYLKWNRRQYFQRYRATFSYNVRISNDLRAIAYPHPTIRSKYLWAHSFRFMFQFGRIDTCLFTCKLPLIHSAAQLLLTSHYYPLCRRKHTFFITHGSSVSYHYVLLYYSLLSR